MKKVLSILTIAVITAVSLYAQDMESATALYNEGATALNAGDKTTALKYFEEALGQAEVIGPEAEELLFNCQRNIPTLLNAIGKELASENKLDSAIIVLNEAAAVAEEYGIEDVLVEAQSLIPQIYMQLGNIAFKQRDYESAIKNYNEAITINPNDAAAYLSIGKAAGQMNDLKTAEEALSKASELGQKNAADKVLATLYTNAASLSLRAKDNQTAFNYAVKSVEILENPIPNALDIAGRAAINLKDYNAAIEYLEKFIEASPNARNIDETKFRLATAYEATGDKTNACVNYKAILNNPQFAEYAKHKVDNELKCQ